MSLPFQVDLLNLMGWCPVGSVDLETANETMESIILAYKATDLVKPFQFSATQLSSLLFSLRAKGLSDVPLQATSWDEGEYTFIQVGKTLPENPAP